VQAEDVSSDQPATNRLIREVNNINRQIQAPGHGRFKPSGVGGQG
jgi:hypothetical protein